MEFRKTIKLEQSDYLSFNYFTVGKMLIPFPVLIVALIFMFVLSDRGATAVWTDMLITAVIAIVIAGLAVFLFVFVLKNKLTKLFRTNRIMQAPSDYLLDAAGVHASNEFGNSNVPWPNIVKAAESKKAYYIFIAKNQAFILPKRLIAPAEAEALRALLQQYLPPEKVKLK